MLTVMEWLGSECVQLIESKSWEIDVPGSSLLRPKILGDKHKPIMNVTLDILRSGRKRGRTNSSQTLTHYTELYTKRIILSKQHKGSGTVHLEDLTISNGHIN